MSIFILYRYQDEGFLKWYLESSSETMIHHPAISYSGNYPHWGTPPITRSNGIGVPKSGKNKKNYGGENNLKTSRCSTSMLVYSIVTFAKTWRWTLISLSFCKFQIIYWVHSSHGYRSNTSYPCYTPKQLLLHFHLPENGIIGGVDPQPNLTNLQFGLVQSDLWLFISGSWVGKFWHFRMVSFLRLHGNWVKICYLQIGLTKNDKFIPSVRDPYVSKTRMLLITSWAQLHFLWFCQNHIFFYSEIMYQCQPASGDHNICQNRQDLRTHALGRTGTHLHAADKPIPEKHELWGRPSMGGYHRGP